MAREQRKDVDYFPHKCNHSAALHVIETKYGNDGYCAYYRLMEELGKAKNHYIKIANEMTFMYLVSALKVSDEIAKNIISDLVKLEVFDKHLYEEYQVIWSEDFTESVKDAYRNRVNLIFQYSDVLSEISGKNGQSSARLTQETEKKALVIPKVKKSKEKESKVEYSKEERESKNQRFSPPSQSEVEEYFSSKINETFWTETECQKEAKKFVDFYTSKNWYVGKNKMQKWKSAASGWINKKEEFNNQKNNGNGNKNSGGNSKGDQNGDKDFGQL
ncbi:DUF4373 domain-containing protein [Pedobacter zeae]|uniref:Lin1244/Lin1753-like N-terminal domain-containing protein n=1 Tax=Pedobacter zeae TaxID=1737356 RepID=A0A7W6K9R5_9SPHI|nr:DUF4373 domain-containing protein [Pedobacter zeae]MBB4107712.1 hypothetical protein [Pedobacter zeae]GGG97550.1 hypothetical protein GCM10007422_09400 [Pedobacter zeae]